MAKMDDHSAPGTKIVFAHPGNGYAHDQETAREHLEVGEVYTVERTEVGRWHTDVFIKEVPGVAFNSPMFDEY